MATVLVVDDERTIADLVEVYLENEGFKVLKASDASTALALAGNILSTWRYSTSCCPT